MIHNIALLVKRNRSRLIRVGVVGVTLCVLPAVGFLMIKMPPALVLLALAAPFAILAMVYIAAATRTQRQEEQSNEHREKGDLSDD